jgi:hypothetical protein
MAVRLLAVAEILVWSPEQLRFDSLFLSEEYQSVPMRAGILILPSATPVPEEMFLRPLNGGALLRI